ncbi:MAG: hypothetical protein F6J93_28255 [Oscillatoria sp. SIO1A7]|nr:hypothetical protein [Oscillatoria sp. SIO1A7]
MLSPLRSLDTPCPHVSTSPCPQFPNQLSSYSGSQISVINDRDGKCRGDSIPKTVSAVERQPPSWDATPVATSHQAREML